MQTRELAQPQARNLRVGELVEVLSREEILATLDENGELDSLPFMPEMLQFCGRRFTVYKVAHKLCDTISRTGMHRMRNAVHLTGLRCDGQAHGGCQAGCLLYWKQAWLKRIGPSEQNGSAADGQSQAAHCTLPLLTAATQNGLDPNGEELFSCQATQILRAAPECLPLRNLKQYRWDIRSGNVGVLTMFRTLCIGLFNRLQDYSRRHLPRQLQIRGGQRFPVIEGTLTTTPTGRTDLQAGELVRIKSKEEIIATLDKNMRNRGLSFEQEMSRYCGRQARVLRRVDSIVDDKTGKMLHFKNPCLILEDVVCAGAYNANCPRSIYPFWREIWLERVE